MVLGASNGPQLPGKPTHQAMTGLRRKSVRSPSLASSAMARPTAMAEDDGQGDLEDFLRDPLFA